MRREVIEHSWCWGEEAPGVGYRFFWKDPKSLGTGSAGPAAVKLPNCRRPDAESPASQHEDGPVPLPVSIGALAPWWPAREALEVASLTGPVVQRETACPKPQQERTRDSCLTRPACHLNSVLPFALPHPGAAAGVRQTAGGGGGPPSVSIRLGGARSCM